jgi:hypothetical protein
MGSGMMRTPHAIWPSAENRGVHGGDGHIWLEQVTQFAIV